MKFFFFAQVRLSSYLGLDKWSKWVSRRQPEYISFPRIHRIHTSLASDKSSRFMRSCGRFFHLKGWDEGMAGYVQSKIKKSTHCKRSSFTPVFFLGRCVCVLLTFSVHTWCLETSMCEGEKRILKIPSELAYGHRGGTSICAHTYIYNSVCLVLEC